VSTWQRDWESESYVKFIRHVVNLQGVRIEKVQGDDKLNIRGDCWKQSFPNIFS
jgi:hypothetical protein